MTRTEALRTLAAKVEEGEYNGAPFNWSTNKKVYHAYHGSLDAAKALHEEVLPGWGYVLALDAYMEPFAVVYNPNGDFETDETYSSNPARSWLLAIIKALIAEEEAQ